MFLSALLTTLAATAYAAESPLIISDLVTGGVQPCADYQHQPSAGHRMESGRDDREAGGGTHREVYTTDGYLSEATHGLPKAAERLERLMPGEARELPLDPLAAGAKVRRHRDRAGRRHGDGG